MGLLRCNVEEVAKAVVCGIAAHGILEGEKEMKEHDIVIALSDLDEGRVQKGAQGTVIDVYANPEGYEVEFEVADGWLAVSCDPQDIELRGVAMRKAV